MSRSTMSRGALALGVLLCLLSAPSARAGDDDFEEETVTSGAPASRAAPLEDVTEEVAEDAPAAEVEAAYPPQVIKGAQALGLPEAFISRCYEGTRMVYRRDYKGARAYFAALAKDHPDMAIEQVGLVLIYQSLMMENFDFRFEQQYQFQSDKAIEELEAALESGEGSAGEVALRHFFAGAMMGVESIHVMRRGDFLPALGRGLDAIKHIDEVKRLAPDFKDPLLGDGLYKYWRSVITLNSRVLPDFEDLRAEGIAAMKEVERDGVFLGPGATLSLAFTWIEERELDRALASCVKNYKVFPRSVINNLVLSRVYMYERRYPESLRVLGEILEEAPDNRRVHYYFATVYLRQGELDAAEASVDRYLAFPDLDPYFQAQGLHRKGDIAYRRKQFSEAEALYKQALDVGDYKPAKAKLDRMKELRREGKISY